MRKHLGHRICDGMIGVRLQRLLLSKRYFASCRIRGAFS